MTGEKILKFYDGIEVSVHASIRMKDYLNIEERGLDFDEIISIFMKSKRIRRDEMHAEGYRTRKRRKEYTWFFKTEVLGTPIIFVVIESLQTERTLFIKTVYSENRQNIALRDNGEGIKGSTRKKRRRWL